MPDRFELRTSGKCISGEEVKAAQVAYQAERTLAEHETFTAFLNYFQSPLR